MGAALVGALGWVLAQTSLSVGTYGLREKTPFGWLCTAAGETLARCSYDLLFIIRGSVPVPDACFIFLDEKAAIDMGQNGPIWNRRLHAQLVRLLTTGGARAVLFDVVFPDESETPGVDEDFAQAIRENGCVILAGMLGAEESRDIGGGLHTSSTQIIPPPDLLRDAAADWGTIVFDPLDGDYGVRRVPPGAGGIPSAPWKTARMLGAPLGDARDEEGKTRWLNYYGPAGCFTSFRVSDVLQGRVMPETFGGKIVIIGGRSALAGIGFGKDDFRNPYCLLGGGFSPGAEVHLTALLNLLGGTWLTRMDQAREPWLVLGFGVLLGGMLPRFRPHIGALLGTLAAAAVAAFVWWMFAQHRVWFAWCVPVFVQAPVALAWAVGARYFIEERRRIALRNAFGHYLSPHIADRIADSDFDLSPGGSVIDASVLFTDLEGFTPLSEELSKPELVTEVLVKYFSQTTAHILDHHGMVMRFVGDAVTAVWNAPLAQPDHVRMAARAACRLIESARMEVHGHTLRTRIGLHTGRVLAGNIGSSERFDYAIVGDPVNFASRLEGLNKYLGTNVLISEAVRCELGDDFNLRCLGEFRVVGRREASVIYEMLGTHADSTQEEWCITFEKGVGAFRAANLNAAERLMRETLRMRGGSDGPSDFYLGQIATLRAVGIPRDWKGVIECEKK